MKKMWSKPKLETLDVKHPMIPWKDICKIFPGLPICKGHGGGGGKDNDPIFDS